MLELTVEELVKEYPDFMVDSTRESIIKNNYKLRTSMKEALITQLKCCYESVEYCAGRKGVPTKFKLDKLKEESDEYFGSRLGGRPEIDLSEEFLLLNNWVSEIRPMDDEVSKRNKKVYSASRIINEAFKLKKVNLVVEILLLDTKTNFKAPTYVKYRGYNQDEYTKKQLKNQSKELSRVYTDNVRRLQKQIVERWLSTNGVNFNEVYMAKNGNYFYSIEKEKYDEFKKFDSYHRELLENLNMKQSRIDEHVSRFVRGKFGFDFAYIAYDFYNNSILKNSVSNLLMCKENLYTRLFESAKSSNENSKIYPENWNIEKDNLSIKLKRLKEFKDFSEIVWSVVFNQLENENPEIKKLIDEVNQKYFENMIN